MSVQDTSGRGILLNWLSCCVSGSFYILEIHSGCALVNACSILLSFINPSWELDYRHPFLVSHFPQMLFLPTYFSLSENHKQYFLVQVQVAGPGLVCIGSGYSTKSFIENSLLNEKKKHLTPYFLFTLCFLFPPFCSASTTRWWKTELTFVWRRVHMCHWKEIVGKAEKKNIQLC